MNDTNTGLTPSEFISASVRGGWSKIAKLIEPSVTYFESDEYAQSAYWHISGKVKEVPMLLAGGQWGKMWTRTSIELRLEEILLDPNAWSAVGKDRGWHHKESCTSGGRCNSEDEYKDRQLKFVSLLQDGQTLLGALAESTR